MSIRFWTNLWSKRKVTLVHNLTFKVVNFLQFKKEAPVPPVKRKTGELRNWFRA